LPSSKRRGQLQARIPLQQFFNSHIAKQIWRKRRLEPTASELKRDVTLRRHMPSPRRHLRVDLNLPTLIGWISSP
jgi:hypothetical protein